MSTGWVAGSVRATALARRRVGAAGARALASAASLDEALSLLVGTPYGHEVRVDQSLAEAQHAVAATLLWHLRVLAGWVPRQGTDLVRTFAAGFEVANVDEHLHALAGGGADPSFRLGTLATAWPRLARTGTVADVRATLTTSGWGDPGGDTPAAVRVGMRLAWMSRVAIAVQPAEAWAAGAAALLAARETHVGGRPLTDQQRVSAEPLLRSGWSGTRSLPDFAAALPPSARWAVAGVERPEELWRAEAAWWRRVEHDGFVLLRRGGFSDTPVIGAVAVLAADAWRVRAALEVAARPGVDAVAMEAFDAMA
jgi:hypothetical protein